MNARLARFGGVVVLLCGLMIAAAPAMAGVVMVNGTGLGPIPDSPPGGATCGEPGTPLDTSFVVSGVAGNITDINVSIEFGPGHTWGGDVTATLIAPGGSPSFVLFGRTGAVTATGCGTSSDLVGPYLFVDPSVSSNNLWTAAGASPIPAGTYMTTPEGGAGAVDPPAGTPFNAAFQALAPAQINGTWTLRFVDNGESDTGTVSATALTITFEEVTPVPTLDDVGRLLLVVLLLAVGTFMLRRRRGE